MRVDFIIIAKYFAYYDHQYYYGYSNIVLYFLLIIFPLQRVPFSLPLFH